MNFLPTITFKKMQIFQNPPFLLSDYCNSTSEFIFLSVESKVALFITIAAGRTFCCIVKVFDVLRFDEMVAFPTYLTATVLHLYFKKLHSSVHNLEHIVFLVVIWCEGVGNV